MARLESKSFYSQKSFLDLMDMRSKLILFIFINISTLYMNNVGLLAISISILSLYFFQKLSILAILKEIRIFLFILLLVFISRSLTTSGTIITIFDTEFFSITREGIEEGLFFSWRLLTVVLFAILLIRTSTTVEIKAAIQWFLKPIPFIPEKRIAIMLSLMIQYLPLIIEQAGEVSGAQKSRGVENRKNPIYRMSTFIVPWVSRIFTNADSLVYSMEARCYSENRTDPEFSFRIKDGLALFVGILFCSFFTYL